VGVKFTMPKMSAFEPLPVPAPIQCAWHPYRRGESTEGLIVPWLAQVLGDATHAAAIGRDAHGRPYLIGSMESVDLNWSHSGEMLLVALAAGLRLGVDVEFQRPRRNTLALAERFFARTEAAQLRALPESVREIAFTHLWCAKEALLKAHGRGISYGLERVVFALEGDGWNLVRCEGPLGPAQDWKVYSFTPQPGYLAALAWR